MNIQNRYLSVIFILLIILAIYSCDKNSIRDYQANNTSPDKINTKDDEFNNVIDRLAFAGTGIHICDDESVKEDLSSFESGSKQLKDIVFNSNIQKCYLLDENGLTINLSDKCYNENNRRMYTEIQLKLNSKSKKYTEEQVDRIHKVCVEPRYNSSGDRFNR